MLSNFKMLRFIFLGIPQQIDYKFTQPPDSSNRRANDEYSTSSVNTNPVILSEGQVFRAEVGESIVLPCNIRNLGPMILLWKKGTRVLTAGKTKVRRDDRMNLLDNETDLQIQNLKISDGGEYICEVETDAEEPSTIVHTLEILGIYLFIYFKN